MIVLASLPGSSKYVFDFTVRPMTKINESKQLYSGSIRYKKKILWLINSQVSLLSGSNNQPSSILPYDKYGGGRYILAQSALPSSIANDVSITPFGFIPTPSALDYKLGSTSLVEADYQKSYSPVDDAPQVPFSNFVTEKMGENNGHISFSPRNGQFIINQLSTNTTLQNQKITTAYLCGSKIQIGGDAVVCGNNTATYTTGFAPYISWSVITGSNLIDITSPLNQPQISFIPKVGANGLVKLQAYLYGDGSSNTVTKTLWIGSPLIDIDPDPNNTNYVTFYAVGSSTGASINNPMLAEEGLMPTSIVWRRLDNGATKTGYSYFATFPNYNSSFDVEVKATNSCGTFTTYATIAPPPPPLCVTYSVAKVSGSASTYKIIDPCSSSMVNAKSASNSIASKSSSDKLSGLNTTVSNAMGKIVISTNQLEFNIDNQLPGVYYLRIVKNGKVVHTQNLLKN